MLSQIAKTANRCRLPAKPRKPASLHSLLVAAVLIALSIINCRMPQKTEDKALSEGPKNESQTPHGPLEMHRRAIAIDMHADTPQRLVDEAVDLSKRLPNGHVDAVRMKEGELDAQFFSIWVEPELFGGGGPTAIRRAHDQIEAVRALAEKYPETWELATSAADIRRIAAAGKLAALMGLEGGYAIDERIENVEIGRAHV